MSFSLTLNFNSFDELQAAVAKLDGAAPTADAAPAPAPKPKAAAKAPPPAAAAPAEPAPTPAPSPAPAAAAPAPAGKAVDYPTLQKAVFELAGLVQKKGLDSAEHVLSIAVGLGAPNFKALDAGKWSEALEAVKAKTAEVAALEVEVA